MTGTPWRDAAYGVVDLELSGLDPARDEILSFAVVPVEGGRALPGRLLYRLVRPARMPEAETIRIHGLREADLAAAPPLDEAVGELAAAIEGRVLVAHFAAVEAGFLTSALEPRGLRAPSSLIDTAALALELQRRGGLRLRRERGLALSELARTLNLPVHRPHHADGDALTTAQAFLALAAKLDAIKPVSAEGLQRLSEPPPPRLAWWRRLRTRISRPRGG